LWTSTPREPLAAAIDIVSRSGPTAVFLDVDLSFPLPKNEKDAALRNLLGDYGNVQTARAPLVLVRPVISTRITPPYLLEERSTDYDSFVPPNSPDIMWATTVFEEGSDALVRHWRLVEPVCDRGRPKVLPSAELALAAVSVKKRADLDETLRKLTPPNCGTRELLPDKTVPRLNLDHNLVVGFAEGETSRRIIYSLDWRQPGEFEPPGPRSFGPMIDFDGRLVPLVTVLPIGRVLAAWVDRASTEKDVDAALKDLFFGRIVIIGGSFAQSGDIHLTPLGPMPGAMIVINAVHALLSFGTPHEPELSERLTFSFALVVLTALLFHWLRPAVAAIAMGAVLSTLMVTTLSRYRSGVMLDLALPAAGVLVHRQLLAISAFVRALRKDGWRALLAKPREAPLEHQSLTAFPDGCGSARARACACRRHGN
jgi:hypothetical protein